MELKKQDVDDFLGIITALRNRNVTQKEMVRNLSMAAPTFSNLKNFLSDLYFNKEESISIDNEYNMYDGGRPPISLIENLTHLTDSLKKHGDFNKSSSSSWLDIYGEEITKTYTLLKSRPNNSIIGSFVLHYNSNDQRRIIADSLTISYDDNVKQVVVVLGEKQSRFSYFGILVFINTYLATIHLINAEHIEDIYTINLEIQFMSLDKKTTFFRGIMLGINKNRLPMAEKVVIVNLDEAKDNKFFKRVEIDKEEPNHQINKDVMEYLSKSKNTSIHCQNIKDPNYTLKDLNL